jgi:hypothetical protein
MVAKSKEYLVSHGKTGAVGRFLAASPEPMRRGEQVVIEGDRGLTFGVVLCEATERQARLLGPAPLGKLLRRADIADQAARRSLQEREQQVFDQARRFVAYLGLPLEVLDVELSLDGRRVIIQHLLAADCDPTALVDRIAAENGLEVWLENLAPPVEAANASGGCGKPDCGRSGGGGCTSCGSGGCSSCGSGVDLRAYFSHLRNKMDKERRTPLL